MGQEQSSVPSTSSGGNSSTSPIVTPPPIDPALPMPRLRRFLYDVNSYDEKFPSYVTQANLTESSVINLIQLKPDVLLSTFKGNPRALATIESAHSVHTRRISKKYNSYEDRPGKSRYHIGRYGSPTSIFKRFNIFSSPFSLKQTFQIKGKPYLERVHKISRINLLIFFVFLIFAVSTLNWIPFAAYFIGICISWVGMQVQYNDSNTKRAFRGYLFLTIISLLEIGLLVWFLTDDTLCLQLYRNSGSQEGPTTYCATFDTTIYINGILTFLLTIDFIFCLFFIRRFTNPPVEKPPTTNTPSNAESTDPEAPTS